MLATRKRKNIYQHSSKGALKSLIFALNDSAKAFEVRYFRSSQFRRKVRKMRGNIVLTREVRSLQFCCIIVEVLRSF